MNNKLEVNGNFIRCEKLKESAESNDDFVFKKEQFPLYKVNKIYLKDRSSLAFDINENDVVMLEDAKGALIKLNEEEFLIPVHYIVAKVAM